MHGRRSSMHLRWTGRAQYRPFDQSVTGFDSPPDIVRPALSNEDIVPESIPGVCRRGVSIKSSRLLQIGARHLETLRSGEFEIELCTQDQVVGAAFIWPTPGQPLCLCDLYPGVDLSCCLRTDLIQSF